MVNSCSDWISIPLLKICAITKRITAINNHTEAPSSSNAAESGIVIPFADNHLLYFVPQEENNPMSNAR